MVLYVYKASDESRSSKIRLSEGARFHLSLHVSRRLVGCTHRLCTCSVLFASWA